MTQLERRQPWPAILQDSSRDAIGEINKYDFRNEEKYVFKARKGLDRRIVAEISEMKGEPAWMRDFRLKSLEIFESKPMPQWGGRINIDFQDVYYYLKPVAEQGRSWDDVPAEIKSTFDKLGIPEAEKKYLAGVKAQYESEVVYGSLQENLAKQGVIFTDTDTALREHPDLLREYFSTIIPPTDNKFAALNSAVWSGGSFVYVPPGVKIEFPLQAYFRINAAQMGQFERTLIIVDEGRPGPLRRRLHRADVQQRKPPLRRRRGDRQTRLPRPLHDHPELGEQHLQPRDQAGGRLSRLPGRMGRRQPRQPLDDEVSGRFTCSNPAPAARSFPSPSPPPASTRTPGPRRSTARRTPPAASSRSRSRRTAAGPATAACSRCSRGRRRSARTSSATP